LPKHTRVGSSFLLFFFVFGIRQAIDALKYFQLVSEWLQSLVYTFAQILFICTLIILIKTENCNFQDHGFFIPDDLSGCLSISLILAFVYVIVTIFLSGNLLGFEAFPASPLSQVFAGVINSLLASIAVEGVFRGYIQKNLTTFFGLSKALLISSLMFASYSIPFLSYLGLDSATIIVNALFFVLEGFFLGFLFQRTATLISPITFYTAISFLQYFTPLNVVTTEYTIRFFQIMAYIILVQLLHLLLILRTHQLKSRGRF